VHINRYVVVEDCGVLINPAIVEGQVRGGVAQGIGAVLLERSAYDDNGQFLAGSFMDYLLPTATEIPRIEIEHLQTVPLDADVNFRGVGEGGMIVTPPTIGNAIADALRRGDLRAAPPAPADPRADRHDRSRVARPPRSLSRHAPPGCSTRQRTNCLAVMPG
jgi:CO/xanthine dehydrogenase Mo-binding subunit